MLVIARKVLRIWSPDQVLRLLFRLDRWLYILESRMAIVYDGGIHTKHRHMRYDAFFAKWVLPGERVLDLGCGMGTVTYHIAEHADAYVLGVDIDSTAILQARRRHAHPNAAYCIGDISERFLSGAFDVIILSNVLEHLSGRQAFLRQIQRELSPSRLLIRAPLYERDWRVPLRHELGLEWRLDATHKIEYTLESFAEEMAGADLQIAHQEVRWGEIWAVAVPRC